VWDRILYQVRAGEVGTQTKTSEGATMTLEGQSQVACQQAVVYFKAVGLLDPTAKQVNAELLRHVVLNRRLLAMEGQTEIEQWNRGK